MHDNVTSLLKSFHLAATKHSVIHNTALLLVFNENPRFRVFPQIQITSLNRSFAEFKLLIVWPLVLQTYRSNPAVIRLVNTNRQCLYCRLTDLKIACDFDAFQTRVNMQGHCSPFSYSLSRKTELAPCLGFAILISFVISGADIQGHGLSVKSN